MLIGWMIDLGVLLFDVVFAMLGVLPEVPGPIVNVIDTVFGIMFNAIGLAGVFVDFSMVKTLIPLAIAIINFDHIVKLITYILKKIPLLGIE